MIGYIHSIETFGTVDGGGIRFVLFLQGCALHCAFCHNPDTWLTKGKPATVEEIVSQLREYKTFFDLSGGGLTVSGGEPLLQEPFVHELFQRAGERGVHCTLDTSGYCKKADLLDVLPVTDQVLFSIKVVDAEKHRRLTASSNEEILKNLRLVVESDLPLVLRYVMIPTINDAGEDVESLAALVLSFRRRIPVEILPYNKLGVSKWAELGSCDPLGQIPAATPQQADDFKTRLRTHGLNIN